jgi:hypothetical protein
MADVVSMDAGLTATVLAVGVLAAVALTVGSVAGALMAGAVDLPDAEASIMVADSRAVVSEAVPQAGSTVVAEAAFTEVVEAGFTAAEAVGSTVVAEATAADIAN